MSAGLLHECDLQTDKAAAVRTPILAFISIFAAIEALWSEQLRRHSRSTPFSQTHEAKHPQTHLSHRHAKERRLISGIGWLASMRALE
jgi:hypothetical protein